jgi:hypothetical protein
VSRRRSEGEALARWFEQVGLRLDGDEATLFLAAALVLLEPELGLRQRVRTGMPPTEEQRAALSALWLQTGAPPPVPTPMPLHPLAPGVFGAAWRRLRSTFARALRPEPQ